MHRHQQGILKHVGNTVTRDGQLILGWETQILTIDELNTAIRIRSERLANLIKYDCPSLVIMNETVLLDYDLKLFRQAMESTIRYAERAKKMKIDEKTPVGLGNEDSNQSKD